MLFVVLCFIVVFARRIRKCVGGAVCVRWQGVWFGALVVCRAHGCGISEESKRRRPTGSRAMGLPPGVRRPDSSASRAVAMAVGFVFLIR